MDNLFLIFLMAVFAVVILYDLLGHRHGKIRRGFLDWIFLCLLAVGFTVSAVRGLGGMIEENSRSKPGMYLASRYLQDGDAEKARAAAKSDGSLTKAQEDLLDVLFAAVEGDYPTVYFSSERLLEEKEVSGEQQSCVEELNKIAGVYLGQDSSSEEFAALFETDEDPDFSNTSGYQAPSKVLSLVNSCLEAENIKETEELEDYYLLDSQVRSQNPDSIDSALVEKMTEKYQGSQEIRKLAVKYYALQNNYSEAERQARELLDLEQSAENYVIYTDVIAQSVYSGNTGEESDPEKDRLLEKAQELEEQAGQYEADEEKQEKLLNEAEELRQEAANVDLYRAINFLEAKRPLFGDNSGLYDTQIAKLYLAAGDRDSAREKIYEVLDDADSLSDDSPVKESLEDVIDAYNQTTSEEVSPVLKSSVREFVEAQSQDVIQVGEDTINGKMADYVTSTLKYDKLGIFISRIDTSNYPQITAYLNVNGKKEGRWSMASEFYADDFEIIDTQYQIDDFEMNADASRTGVDIAIVIDTSGSMAGDPLEDAKTAAQACVEDMDTDLQQIAVVSYNSDAQTVVEKTSSRESLTYGISQMTSGGDTNISSGILEGLDAISGGNAGSKALILMTDGQDGDTQAIDEATARANREGISVYTVGLGDVNEEYLKNIAEQTGGKFILADNSTELEDIYLTLQKYIINNYVLTYTVKENTDTDPRYLMASIPEYQVSAQKDYTIGGGTDEATEAESGGIGPEASDNSLITSVSPGAVSVEEVSRGLSVTVKGENFAEGMHVNIGNLELQDVEVADANTLTGTLKGSLSTGVYRASAQYPDGRVGVKNSALYVFRAGTASAVRIGGTVIRADTIGQISENTFVASGNVLINDFIHFSANLEIQASALPEDFSMDSGQTSYLGNSGTVSGNGKIYISYPKASQTETGFASMVLDGKDYVVREGAVEFEIQGMDTSMGQSFDLTVPGITNVTVGSVSIETDGIKVHINELNPKKIVDSVKESLGGTDTGTEEKEAVDAAEDKEDDKEDKGESRDKAFSFQAADTSASLDLAIRQNNIDFGGEITLNVNDALRFGAFGLREIGLKFNTLDENQEYWKVSGAIDFSTIVKGFGGAGISGMNASISSWYWMFDSMEVGLDLYPGIGIYNVLYVDEMALKVEGVSGLIADAGWVSDNVKSILFAGQDLQALKENKPDFKLTGTVGADVNLFKSLNLPVPEDMTKWGELGTIDGDITLNFTEPSFDISAALNLLQHEIANASLGFGQSGFYINARAQLELEMLGMQLGGGIEIGLDASWEQLGVGLGLDGHVDCNMLNLHCQGDIRLDVDVRTDGTLFSVSIAENGNEHRFWYEDNGELFLWNKIHFS